MQAFFVVVLVSVLAASVAFFAVMGLRQKRRTEVLSRRAHEMGLRFSVTDPFDIPVRYGDFALIASGHSGRAENVTYGHVGTWPLRGFDFRYELGHGTRRVTKLYSVVVVETELHLPGVLMWNDADVEFAPITSCHCDGHLDCWTYAGEEAFARVLAAACGDLAGDGTSMETRGSALMLCVPVRGRVGGAHGRLGKALSMIEALRGPLDGSRRATGAPGDDSTQQNVESPRAS